jgi:Nucleotidyl transferase AbiEii toxin, Type IV TA system
LTKPASKNLPASVRQKLANLARERNVDFGRILVKYGLERILFRLSRSRHRDVFILKGALLFELWTEQRFRPTRDVDFLARGDNAPERFTHIFRELCVLEVDEDGLRFDAETVEAGRIVAVGTTIADRPPRRSVRARLRIRLLLGMNRGETCCWPHTVQSLGHALPALCRTHV